MSGIKQPEFSAKAGSGNAHHGQGYGKTLPADSGYFSQIENDKAVYSLLSHNIGSGRGGDKKIHIGAAVDSLNRYIQNEQRDIEFELIQNANMTVVKVISRRTGEVIRQIPEQEVVDLARKLDNKEPLHLFNTLV